MEQQSDSTEQPARTASSDADSGCALDDYTWVPPGLTAQQVSRCIRVIRYCIMYSKKLSASQLSLQHVKMLGSY